MHAGHEGARHREEPPGIVLAQIVLSREGERPEVFEAA
jgi:hypothetical protein